MGSIQNSAAEDTDASNLKRPAGSYILFTKNEIELMKSGGHVQKISKDVRTAITEKWKSLPEDAKLVFKREAKKNSEKYRIKKANIKKEPHKQVALKTRCAPQRVMKMVGKLNECQKCVIQELGFGGILDLKYSRLDRELCRFLVDRFDPNQCALHIGSRKLLISPRDIEDMMGLKSNGIDIRISRNLKETKSVCQLYGLKEVGNITIAEVEEQLMEIKTSGNTFIFYFLLFVLSIFLCPTPKLTVKRSLILILHEIENVKNLNWGKFVLEFLVEGVQKFREDKSAGVNGCVMLLMLYYHEHVNTERIVEQLPKQPQLLHATGSLDRPKLISTHSTDLISSEDEDNNHQIGRPCQSDHMKYQGFGEGNFGLQNQLSSFKKVILDELATSKRDILNEMRSLTNRIIGNMNENRARVESNLGLENQLSSFKNEVLDELTTCKSELLNEMRSEAQVERNPRLGNQLSSFKNEVLDELATCKSELLNEMRSEAQVERNPGLENQLSSFKNEVLDELATWKSDSLNEIRSLARKHIGDMNENEAQDDVQLVNTEGKMASPSSIQGIMKIVGNVDPDVPNQPIDESDNETCRPPIVISDMEFTNNSSKDTFVGPSHMRIDDLQLQAENKDVDMLELTFPSNVAAPTPKLAFTPPKVPLRKTRQRKPSQIVSSPFVVPKRKNKKKAGDLPNDLSWGSSNTEVFVNEFYPLTDSETVLCNYIFNKKLPESEVLSDMIYDNADRNAFHSLLPEQWISSVIINLYVCKRTHEEKRRLIDPPVWYLPTYFSKKILDEDGKSNICGWIKKSFWDEKKYMSDLAVCDQIYIPMNDNNNHWYLCVVNFQKSCIHIFDSSPSASSTDSRKKAVQTVIECLDKFLTFVENDKYTNKIVDFPFISSSTNHTQKNGYDCGLYVIKRIYLNHIKDNLSFEDARSKNMRYKLAVELVIDEANKEKSTILKKAHALNALSQF